MRVHHAANDGTDAFEQVSVEVMFWDDRLGYGPPKDEADEADLYDWGLDPNDIGLSYFPGPRNIRRKAA